MFSLTPMPTNGDVATKKKKECVNMKAIISAHKTGNTAKANDAATTQLKYVLRNYGYTNLMEVAGRYNGHNEVSVVVDNVRNTDIDDLASIAGMFRQECILLEDDMGTGFLKSCEHPDWPLHCIGKRRISDDVPDYSQDWTFYPDTKTFVRYI
jgi:hypothetical protein